MTLTDRIAADLGWPELGADALEEFIAGATPGIVFLRGAASLPETADVAVVLRELADRVPALRIALVPPLAEAAARRRLGVTLSPATVFVRGGAIAARLERMRDWTEYLAALHGTDALEPA